MLRGPVAFLAVDWLLAFCFAHPGPAACQSDPTADACHLLSRTQIAIATGVQVADGQQGAPIPGSLGNCWWQGANRTQIVVVIADASHMQVTMQSQVQAGALEVPGLGANAVGDPGTDETGGGYNLSILDAKGGVAVSILGEDGTAQRAVHLAELIEAHRKGPPS